MGKLTRCPDCDREVSIAAKMCPQCGRVLGGASRGAGRSIAKMLVLLVFIFVAFLAYNSYDFDNTASMATTIFYAFVASVCLVIFVRLFRP